MVNRTSDERGGGIVLPFPARGVPEVEPLIDKRRLSSAIGMSVSWIEKRACDATFPSYKVGGARRFRVSEVENWITTRRSSTS